MIQSFRFNRREFAGSLGDLGTILPIALGMILVNGILPSAIFFTMGVFYILIGIYYRITVPVQPMKVIGAYAIATAMTPAQIQASALLMALCLLLIGTTRSMERFGRYIPRAVIRGIQLSTGILLMVKGIRMIAGTAHLKGLKDIAEPYLLVQRIGPVPVGLVLGTAAVLITLFFLNNKKLPAGLLVMAFGLVSGLVLGTGEGLDTLRMGFFFPRVLPYGFPAAPDFSFVILAVVLPQLPMTLGNAVIAQSDLSHDYFGEAANRMTYTALCISMALGNILSFTFGGIPICHGAGGLAAHYRFGAKTAGSNLIIGTLMVGAALILGSSMTALLFLIPLSVLGVLLVFAGSTLAMTVMDMDTRNDIFVTVTILAVTLAVNLALGAIIGMAIFYGIKRIHI